MSPERTSSRLRYSEGFRKHLRKERTAKNKSKTLITSEERQRKMTTASWSAVNGFLNLATIRNPELLPLYVSEKTRGIIREWYDASYYDATHGNGTGTNRRDQFQKQYIQDKNSEHYNPNLIEAIKPLMAVVDNALFRTNSVKK